MRASVEVLVGIAPSIVKKNGVPASGSTMGNSALKVSKNTLKAALRSFS
jgi:hypothetical protein